MAEKTGHSEKKKDWWGDEYIQHYDADGNKIGTSVEKKDWFGDTYVQRYDKDINKAGTSEERTDWHGDSYTQARDSTGKKSGRSVVKTRFNNDPHTQHYSDVDEKIGTSEKKKTWKGGRYTQHYGNNPAFPAPAAPADDNSSASVSPTAADDDVTSSDSDDSSFYEDQGADRSRTNRTARQTPRHISRRAVLSETDRAKARMKEMERLLARLDGLDEQGLDDVYHSQPELKDYAIARIVMNKETNIATLAMLEDTQEVWGPESRRRLNEIASISQDHAERVALARKQSIAELSYLQRDDPEMHEKLKDHQAYLKRREDERKKQEQEELQHRANRPRFIKFMDWLFGF